MRQIRLLHLAITTMFLALAGSTYGEEMKSETAAAEVPAIEFVRVPGGCYLMGSDKGEKHERPLHKVCLDDFAIGKYEVTQAQWKALMGSNPSHFSGCGDDCPVDQVSWHDAQAFLQALTARTGKQHRLPTEAEWEYACRSGGKDAQYAGGDADKAAWSRETGFEKTHPVGLRTPNDLGIYDMNGNVWEWVQDAFTTPYSSDAMQNNPVINQGEHRVLRGGGWNVKANYVRCSIRNRTPAERRYFTIGFRVLQELKPR